uniref:Uncharacterized protein n=1 Tax=Tanacetum cinerariifolium TaxID=118510 RepID=A0A699HGQ7_TANCI|nr:hypothetical protein [Tanacetum cinerariifolium]
MSTYGSLLKDNCLTFSKCDLLCRILVLPPLTGCDTSSFSSLLRLKDGLSAMATKLADWELKEEMIIAIPNTVDDVPKQQSKNTDGFQQPPKRATRGLKLGSKVHFKLTKQVYQLVSIKNVASSSGSKKQADILRQEARSSNQFGTLNTVEIDDKFAATGVL